MGWRRGDCRGDKGVLCGLEMVGHINVVNEQFCTFIIF